ncbi:MAG TPA: GAF and ANTAR domain-containing protein [Acidimicrobiales bacterium]|nr:GAF and ANTAR domain-containing protein [Acidimicrobiales bacterium]
MGSREGLLADTFLILADTLVDDFDPIEVLTLLTERCGVLLGAAAAGVMLADTCGALQVMAESDERAHILERLQIQNDEGPCLDAFRQSRVVLHGDLAISPWPRFGPAAVTAGLRSIHACPMRLRSQIVGTLNLFRSEPGVLSAADASVAQALAHAATLTLLHHQAASRTQEVTAQLQGALISRVAVEQAKGALAERAKISVDEAFNRLRDYARDHNAKLTDVANAFMARALPESVISQLTRAPSQGRKLGIPGPRATV